MTDRSMKVSTLSPPPSSDRPHKRQCTSSSPHERRHPCLPILEKTDIATISEAYAKYQAIYLPNYIIERTGRTSTNDESTQLDWKDLGDIFNHLNEEDRKSFCVENVADGSVGTSASNENDVATTVATTASELLRPQITEEVAYCSFLIQHDEDALSKLLRRLPMEELCETRRSADTAGTTPESPGREYCGTLKQRGDVAWDYEPCVWIFFGRNNGPASGHHEDLQGRPEHTDSISHDGTWHYQLSGIKRWLLRPTQKLREHFQAVLTDEELMEWTAQGNIGDNDGTANNNIESTEADPKDNNEHTKEHRIQVDCRQGDVLIVNTRLWRHQTILPPQPNPSVSYARDFWVTPRQPSTATAPCSSRIADSESGPNNSCFSAASGMTNLDGLYATDDIEADTIIFKETDMPDCELHRSSTDPNCKVVEFEDGTQAVVSCRKIRAGEFFCIPESDDEDDEEEEEEENDGYVFNKYEEYDATEDDDR